MALLAFSGVQAQHQHGSAAPPAQHQHGSPAPSAPPAQNPAPPAAAATAASHPAHAAPAPPQSPGGIPHTRDASGSAWQPDASPMHAHVFGQRPGSLWEHMLHYNVFLAYDHQSGARGDDQVNSVNWLMRRGFAPRDLDAVYGGQPIGIWVFLRLRPQAMGH
jgi:hypothetical protein